MSEAMDCYNPTPPVPDTGGTSSASSTLSSPCSNNIVKTDLKSQELDLTDCLLNGDINSYLPNNNVCDENIAMDTDMSKDDSCDSAECASGERTQNYSVVEGDVTSVSQSEDTNSLNEASSATESSQEPQTLESIETPLETEEEFDVTPQTSESYVPEEQNNGNLKKPRKKRISSGPGRGRAPKQSVTMYHSQISGDKNAIKIRIKKSSLSPTRPLPPNKKKSGRRKKHKVYSDTDNSDYEKKPKRSRPSATTDNDVSSTQSGEPPEQSVWGDALRLPAEILEKIFEETCAQDGALPTLVRLCKVCKFWKDISLRPPLWKKADLNYVKEKNRTDLRLHWLILNRLTDCEDIVMGEWKIRDIQAAIEAICEHCPKLRGLNLSGWKGLNADNLKYLTNECKKLERLDLSSINSTSAINAQPLVALSQAMNSRLTHLVLAHNKIAGFMQIISALAAHCPNLQLLDISNVKTFAHNTALLHVEKLQIGCPKIKVLRITNSQVWLAPVTLTEQVASPGFPNLEELSLAGLEEDQTTTSRSMDNEGIERLLKTSTKLRLLDVRGCSKLTDSGLVRVPAWDLEHLFLSACYITRLQNSGLELIIQKWSHSLLEVDLAWSTATSSLDAAVMALAEKEQESKLRILNLCGSSVSLEPIKAVLSKCPCLHSINLQSCRALPRGIKRLYTGTAVDELRKSLSDRKTEGSDGEEGKTATTSPKRD
ncbi:F-box/LRR-repeat protein 6 [Euwallacea fornicatus]|uniref:F-box/LRR-repeat protein 6 n=1 Tax=Euwallacea fornicatus TaxID=995702 RepID=UPI00338EDC65